MPLILRGFNVRASKMTYFNALILLTVFNSAIMLAESGTKLPVGVTDFSVLVQSKCPFIDKTEFIKDVMTKSSHINDITRPRGFGKSLSLSMLQHFLDYRKAPSNISSVDIFTGLKISRNKEFCGSHRNQWPLIHVSFRDMNAWNFQNAKTKLFSIMQALYKEHSYLLEGDVLPDEYKQKFTAIMNQTAPAKEMISAISELCLFVYIKTRKKLILLVDDFDVPFRAGYLHNYYYKLKNLMLDEVMRPLVQHSPFVRKAVIMSSNGVTPCSTFEDPSMNLLTDYSLLDESFAATFGFTPNEVGSLLAQTGVGVTQQELTKWYGGYNTTGLELHNPWSILSCLDNQGKTGPYWVRTPGFDLVQRTIGFVGVAEMVTIQYYLMSDCNETLERVLDNSVSLSDLSRWKGALWSVLVHAGYLTAEFKWEKHSRYGYAIRIPNKEVKDEIATWFKGKFSKGAVAVFKQLDGFVENIKKGNIGAIKWFIWKCIAEKGNYYHFSEAIFKEEEYGNYLCKIFTPLKEYYNLGCHAIGPCEDRRFYLTLVPRDKSIKGVVLELEVSKKPSEEQGSENLENLARLALNRIKKGNVTLQFAEAGCRKVIGIGVGISLRSLELEYEEMLVTKPTKKPPHWSDF